MISLGVNGSIVTIEASLAGAFSEAPPSGAED